MSSRLKNFLWIIVVLVAFTLITTFRGETGTNISFGDNTLELTGPEHFSYTLEYDKISSLSLVELSEPGQPVSGNSNRRCQWGTYKNDSWGEYTLCVTTKIENAIRITMQNGEVIVFNYESDETTRAILDMFNELLAAQQTGTAS